MRGKGVVRGIEGVVVRGVKRYERGSGVGVEE